MMGIFRRLVTMSASTRSSTPSAGKSMVTNASAGCVAGVWAMAAFEQQIRISSRTENAALEFMSGSLSLGERVAGYQSPRNRSNQARGRQLHGRRQIRQAVPNL